uniref:Uncharacterized protein n=1 Tax=Meloidogyne hapla TaxID=6305 RepID=A0A1I8BSV8_MELHA
MNKGWASKLIDGNIQTYKQFTHHNYDKIIIIERMVLQSLALLEI